MDIDYILDGETEYKPLTDIYLIDNCVYINTSRLADFIFGTDFEDSEENTSAEDSYENSDESIATETSSSENPDTSENTNPPKTESEDVYLKIDLNSKEVQDTINGTANVELNDAYKELATEIVAVFMDFVEKATEDCESEIISGENGEFKFTLTEKNIAEFVNSLGNVIYNQHGEVLQALIREYEERGEDYKEIVETLKDVEENKEFKELLKSLKEYKYESEEPFLAELKIKMEGGKGNRVFESSVVIEYKDETTEIKSNIQLNIYEKNDLPTLTAPKNIK
jgi:hypothetical protein